MHMRRHVPRMGERHHLVGSLVALLALAAGACGGDPPSLAGVVRTPPQRVAAVNLPVAGEAARTLPMHAPPGELYVVYFGYTSCPDICPTTLSDIGVAVADLPGSLAARVTVVMATVDPERDTDEVMAGYLSHFVEDGIALRTADAGALRDATERFGVRFEVEDHRPGEPYDVAHTAVTYVVDDLGRVVVEWPFGLDARAMTADLMTLLEKESR